MQILFLAKANWLLLLHLRSGLASSRLETMLFDSIHGNSDALELFHISTKLITFDIKMRVVYAMSCYFFEYKLFTVMMIIVIWLCAHVTKCRRLTCQTIVIVIDSVLFILISFMLLFTWIFCEKFQSGKLIVLKVESMVSHFNQLIITS